MSETLTTTPDTHPAPPSLHIDGAPDALQIDKIEALRTAEAAHEQAAVDGIFWMDLDARAEAREKAHADFDDIVKQHLKDNGIEEDDPKYAEYAALLRDSSIDKIDEDEWKPEVLPAGTAGPVRQSGRSLVYGQVRSTYGTATPVPVPAPVPAVPAPTAPTVPLGVPKTTAEIKGVVDALPEIIAARTKVNVLREELAELSAKRQRRLFSRSETLYEFDDKVDQYEEAVNELAKAELKAEKDAGKERDETEERFAAALKLVDNYRQLQELSVDKLKKTKVSGFIRFMTSGGRGMRILKGVGLGVSVGVLGAAVTAVTGGAAAAGLVTAGVAATRFARSYARFDNEENRGVKIADASLDTEVVDKSGATGKDSDETIDLVNKYLLEQLEEDMLTEQDKRRKATRNAMGMVVVGSLAGEALHFGHDLYASHHAHGASGDAHDNPPKGDPKGDGSKPGAGAESPTTHEYADNAGAHTMSNGEGLYQTFHEMGIPQKDWPALLEQAGPKLHDMQDPLAYRMPNGEWGLRMTADGTFPQQGLDIISNTHDHMTGVVTDNASHAADHISDHASEAAPHNHASFDTDTSDTSAADADMTTEVPIAHNMIDSVLDKPVVNPSDISGNPTLSQLTHVIPDSHASYLADKLNLRPSEWQPVEEYIAHQTSQGKPLYGKVFNITTNGVVEFKTNTLPPATMADIITHIPTSVRSRL